MPTYIAAYAIYIASRPRRHYAVIRFRARDCSCAWKILKWKWCSANRRLLRPFVAVSGFSVSANRLKASRSLVENLTIWIQISKSKQWGMQDSSLVLSRLTRARSLSIFRPTEKLRLWSVPYQVFFHRIVKLIILSCWIEHKTSSHSRHMTFINFSL